MHPLMKHIQVVSQQEWPLEVSEVRRYRLSTQDIVCDQFEQQHHSSFKPREFSFSSLEALWNPQMKSSMLGHAHTSTPPPLPRAIYELDSEEWIRAPLLSDGTRRGILHLTCLVWNNALHVYDDTDRMRHIELFSKIVDAEYASIVHSMRIGSKSRPRSIQIAAMTDDEILSNVDVMSALCKAVKVDLLIERDGDTAFSSKEHNMCMSDPSAWFVCDTGTGTWAAKVFKGNSLMTSRLVVQEHAFRRSLGKDYVLESETFARIKQACKASGIHIPANSTHASLVTYLKVVQTDTPITHMNNVVWGCDFDIGSQQGVRRCTKTSGKEND